MSYLFGAVVCSALLGFGLYLQHVEGLEPCPLCVFQRVAFIALGLVFVIAALHGPRKTGAVVYAVSGGLIAATGAGMPRAISGCRTCRRTRCRPADRDCHTCSSNTR